MWFCPSTPEVLLGRLVAVKVLGGGLDEGGEALVGAGAYGSDGDGRGNPLEADQGRRAQLPDGFLLAGQRNRFGQPNFFLGPFEKKIKMNR